MPTEQQQKTRLKITERALYQRINRRLKRDGEYLRTARTPQVETSVGHYFIVNVTGNYIARQRVDLEAIGRELGTIQPWEEL